MTLRSVVSLGRGDGEVSCQSDPLLEARLGVLLRNLTLTEAICDYDNGELKLQKYEVAKPDWNSAFEGVFERARELRFEVEDLRKLLRRLAAATDPQAMQGLLAEVRAPDTETLLSSFWVDYRRIRDGSTDACRDCVELVGAFALRDNLRQDADDRLLEKRICMGAEALIDACRKAYTPLEAMLAVPMPDTLASATRGRIVRARFPEWTLWALPFAAYEYGHTVLDRIPVFRKAIDEESSAQGDDALKERIERLRSGAAAARAPTADSDVTSRAAPISPEHDPGDLRELEERLAASTARARVLLTDAFAARIMGPAYACAAVLLRFDPSREADEAAPADIERAEVVFRVLEHMYPGQPVGPGDEPTTAPYDFVRERVEQPWNDAVARASPPTTSADELRARAGDFVERHRSNLRRGIESAAQYDYFTFEMRGCWKAAHDLSARWQDKHTGDQVCKPDFRDVLNAAWYCRLHQPDDLARLDVLVRTEWDRLIDDRERARADALAGGRRQRSDAGPEAEFSRARQDATERLYDP